mmetsp:Transcript_39105/g.124492  ORF Transcript_39105/g.124492 Transcript_39105/m.124492 type:complete len:137 (+) Transcript_39105:196-606(+)
MHTVRQSTGPGAGSVCHWALLSTPTAPPTRRCTQCGKCCTGAGSVFVNDDDSKNIAGFLGVSLKEFKIKFTKPGRDDSKPGFRQLRNLPGTEVSKGSHHTQPPRPPSLPALPVGAEIAGARCGLIPREPAESEPAC